MQNEKTAETKIMTVSERLDKSSLFVEIKNNRRLEDKLVFLLRFGSTGEWQLNLDTNEIRFDERLLKNLGYEQSDAIGYTDFSWMQEKIHPDDREKTAQDLKEYLLGKKEALSTEHRIRNQSGTYSWFYCNGIAIRNKEDGSPLIIHGVLYEITERKRIEQNNKILAKLPFSNPDVVVIMDLDMNIVYINPQGQAQFSDYMHEMFPENIQSLIIRAYQKNRTEITEFMLGEKCFVMKIKPFAGDRQCMVTISDITEYLRISKERNLYYEALQAVSQALFITDKNGQIIHVNQAFEQLYGYSESEVIGKNPKILNAGLNTYLGFGYSESSYHLLFKEMWEKIKDKKTGRWEGVVLNRSKNGKVMWIRSVTNAVFDEAGEITHFVSIPIDITSSLSREDSTKHDLYKAISELAELRDNETGAHMRRVGIYAKLIAKELGLAEKVCNDLEIFAPMHDIGKVGVPDSILLAKRKLTQEEFRIMRKHTIYGYNIVSKNEEMSLVSQITLSHHERFDGKGYPYGLVGEDIPLVARIVALCDVYDALRSRRPYKEPWTHEQTVAHIVEDSGKHFDPKVVDAFVKLNDKFEKIFNEIVDEEEIGE